MPRAHNAFHYLFVTSLLPSLYQLLMLLSIASYAYTTPAKIATAPLFGYGSSSPSTRISLRRMSDRPGALTSPKISQSEFDYELLLSTPPKRQNTTKIARRPS